MRLAGDDVAHQHVLAPFAGVITRRLVEVDESVIAGQAVVELIDPDRLYVACPVDERDAGRLRVGLAARVTIDSHPGITWTGHVSWVAPLVEEPAIAGVPAPTVFAPRCRHHVGFESGAFYDNELQDAPDPATDIDTTLADWFEGLAPPSLIDGVGGVVTTACVP